VDQHEFDVVVVGSGAAGLTAALVAADQGAKVCVLEASEKLGGTTVFSGGQIWIPNNHLMEAARIPDSFEEGVEYCRAVMGTHVDEELIAVFVRTARNAIMHMADRFGIDFQLSTSPDSFVEYAGGKLRGRCVEVKPYRWRALGQWARRIRRPPWPPYLAPIDVKSMEIGLKVPLRMARRFLIGEVASGLALVSSLVGACLRKNITFHLGTRAQELIYEGERIRYLQAQARGSAVRYRAGQGIVLASGGFEWNRDLVRDLLPAKVEYLATPPIQFGDGLLMAKAVGARLDHTDEAWWWPASVDPNQLYEGKPTARLLLGHTRWPHSIVVDRNGQRFGNESAHNFAFSSRDSDSAAKFPGWTIFDSQYRRKYVVGMSILPFMPDPHWLLRDDTLEGLARKCGINEENLVNTVNRFNKFAREGADADFNRGQAQYDRNYGDHSLIHPNLGTIEKPKFYALPVHLTTVGTKGGPVTNSKGAVMHIDGHPIPGLFAAGNAMARIFGPGILSPGATLGQGMTWGYLCGLNVGLNA
jgi:3-oxosteroid 1-dehydrogenase